MATISRSTGKQVRALGLVSIIIGAVMIIAGAVTWGMVSTKLAAENITVSADAPILAGAKVTGPIEAFVQADVINGHALKATGGKTYAELGKEDPLRATAMNGSFLRSSLFTSVIAFGVALFAIGVGALAIVLGWGLRLVAASQPAEEPVLAASHA
ncbi:MAG TPA: aromatic ring-opening dioxygenase LigA [Propionicimonas sp.]|nr:aromatic ring-opening dioxygenase LigA [Propionicimonas sp.]